MASFKTQQNLLGSAAAGAMMLLFAAGQASGQVIRLRDQASVDPRQNVRLGDIAKVTATDTRTAEALMNLVIVPQVTESRTIRAEAVLMAVITQIGPGALADRLQVAGAATCQLQVGAKPAAQIKTGAPASPAIPAASVQVSPLLGVAARGSDKLGNKAHPKTLSQLITEKLQQDLSAGPDDLRISFDTLNPLLDQPAPASRRWAFHTLTHSLLGTVQVEAQLLEGPRIVQKLTVQMQVLKRATVLVATAAISRGDVITASQFKPDETWLDRNMPTLLTNPKEVIGLEALRDLNLGATLDQRDFRPVVMASRGDMVSVIFMHGNMKVQMKGRAVEEGKLHDSIQIKNESTNEIYNAVLIGKRLAYVGGTLSDAQEKKLRETP